MSFIGPEDRGRFCKPYYLLNSLAIVSYAFVRNRSEYWTLNEPDMWGLTKEQQVLLVLSLLNALKFYVSATLDEFLASLFLFSKVAILGLMFLAGDYYVLGAFVAVSIVTGLVMEAPLYSGPNKFVAFEPIPFADRVLRCLDPVNPKKHDLATRWVVILYTPSNPRWRQLAPVFSELSVQFSSQHLQFGTIDVEKFPQIKDRFNIKDDAGSSQIPSLLLFEKGREIARLPFEKDGVIRKATFRFGEVARYFQLAGLRDGIPIKS